MTKYFLFLVSIVGLFSCQPKGISSTNSNANTNKVQTFGQAITADNAIAFTALVQQMERKDSLFVKVKGKVDAVCQAKGCWMNIVSDDTDKKMVVKFKDYGFFMPLDITGKEVIMEGYAYKEVTSVDELRHYAEDAGKSATEIAAITMPKEEFKFMASGVLLLND
jgi:hypothetical protein